MERYEQEIAEIPNVVMIHVSRDSSEDSAENWAASEGFPWLTVLPDDAERSGLLDYHTRKVVPFYALVDGEGKEIATGSSAVFSKALELGGG